jgi:hypothetical protein
MTLRAEMLQLVRALEAEGIPYALCGGLAMAVHGWPRATLDIDLLIEEDRLPEVRRLAATVGFTHETGFLALAGGRIRLFRLVKFVGQEFIPLDLLLVSPDLETVWSSRRSMPTADGNLTVVSAPGLIQMKILRNSGTDQDDIRKLKGETDEAG